MALSEATDCELSSANGPKREVESEILARLGLEAEVRFAEPAAPGQ
jgi:hypothetical protein